ncbi:MAG: terminase, partial [Candidatus Omnitrophica bacterium]|nr:terminase [Candidatus Omnitrophota bacterium]
MIHLPTIVGAGYSDFWHFQGRYCIVKGSRASKKSQTTA